MPPNHVSRTMVVNAAPVNRPPAATRGCLRAATHGEPAGCAQLRPFSQHAGLDLSGVRNELRAQPYRIRRAGLTRVVTDRCIGRDEAAKKDAGRKHQPANQTHVAHLSPSQDSLLRGAQASVASVPHQVDGSILIGAQQRHRRAPSSRSTRHAIAVITGQREGACGNRRAVGKLHPAPAARKRASELMPAPLKSGIGRAAAGYGVCTTGDLAATDLSGQVVERHVAAKQPVGHGEDNLA